MSIRMLRQVAKSIIDDHGHAAGADWENDNGVRSNPGPRQLEPEGSSESIETAAHRASAMLV